MINSPIIQNVINKSPKIVMIILVLFLLGHQKSSYFGVKSNKNELKVEIPLDFVCQHYGADVEILTSDDIFYEVIQKSDGQRVGSVISSVKFSSQYGGYSGAVPVIILLDQTNVITGVKLLKNRETRKFVSRIVNAGFFEQWNGKHIADLNFSADAVSGATISSEAIIKNIDVAISSFVISHKSSERGFGGYFGSFAVIAVLVLSLLCYLFPTKLRPFRVPILLASIGVLGIWQGAFVSVQLLYNWVINGVSWVQFGLLALVLLAVFVPLFTSKSFYCSYVCPFGATQELIGKITQKKLSIPRPILKIFKYIRQFGLVGIVVLLIANPNFEPSSVEPFSIFMMRSATISVIVIAVLSLVASIFITRPWCRLLCPTGEILSILQRKINYKKTSAK